LRVLPPVLLHLLPLLVLAVRVDGEVAHRRTLGGVADLRILHGAVGSLLYDTSVRLSKLISLISNSSTSI
ncbi:MAG: hypothetical protein MUO29_00520, partial [Desulfobacterales bacterium]|nr:hypothetical protein [Desulfobacterales bacterium]